VKSVEVSFEQQSAIVVFDADKVAVQQLIDAVNRIPYRTGYKASLADGG
jgi:copper chaperone CopZ